MRYLKLFENFQVGDEMYVIMTKDRKYFVSYYEADGDIDLKNIKNLNLKTLINLHQGSSWDTEEEAFNFLNGGDFNFYPYNGIDPNPTDKIINSIIIHEDDEETDYQILEVSGGRRSIKQDRGLYNPTEYTYDTKKTEEMWKSLEPVSLFVGAYEKEKTDYLNIG